MLGDEEAYIQKQETSNNIKFSKQEEGKDNTAMLGELGFTWQDD